MLNKLMPAIAILSLSCARFPTDGLQAALSICEFDVVPNLVQARVDSWDHSYDLWTEQGYLEVSDVKIEIVRSLRGDLSPGPMTATVVGNVDEKGRALAGDLAGARSRPAYMFLHTYQNKVMLGRQALFVVDESGELRNSVAYSRGIDEETFQAAALAENADACTEALQ